MKFNISSTEYILDEIMISRRDEGSRIVYECDYLVAMKILKLTSPQVIHLNSEKPVKRDHMLTSINNCKSSGTPTRSIQSIFNISYEGEGMGYTKYTIGDSYFFFRSLAYERLEIINWTS
jgi:hypothetical protein